MIQGSCSSKFKHKQLKITILGRFLQHWLDLTRIGVRITCKSGASASQSTESICFRSYLTRLVLVVSYYFNNYDNSDEHYIAFKKSTVNETSKSITRACKFCLQRCYWTRGWAEDASSSMFWLLNFVCNCVGYF